MKKFHWNTLTICYGGFVLVSVLMCLLALTTDTLRGLNGQNPITLDMEDCVVTDLQQQEDGSWKVTQLDPQILVPEQQMPLRRVDLYMTSDRNPGEISGYYLTKPGQDYSVMQQVWAREYEPGHFTFQMPRNAQPQLRIDPSSIPGARLTIEKIVLNDATPVWRYFMPSWTWILAAAFLPGLAACFVDWLIYAVGVCKKRK